jgi:phospholipid/cholesterol/gamma-HCH transport system permease protein
MHEIELVEAEGEMRITLPERLDAQTAPTLWQEADKRISGAPDSLRSVRIDAARVTYCDIGAIAMLMDLHESLRVRSVEYHLENLDPKFEPLFELFRDNIATPAPAPQRHRCCMPDELGEATLRMLRELHTFVAFIGELTANAAHLVRHPRSLRLGETAMVMEKAGVNGFPIVALIGFLLGLILAFQSAIPMNMFGAGIYVANLVSLSLVRELGPLITAIIFAGRSGSSFAAELGTMKVNDELNALETMGLNPLSFLAVPRILASMIVVPLLAVFAMVFGIIGAAPVVLSLGYPFITYVDRVASSISIGDILGGLFKAMIFGILISAVGCHQGLQTKAGAQAVGESTTRAVVQSIVFIAVADGLFAVVFYYLGI